MLRLSVPDTLAAIDSTRSRVLAFVAPYALAPAVVYRLELVLEEALMNRRMHAFADGAGHETDVTIDVQSDAIVVSFEDDGLPFDPTGFVPPTSASTDEPPIGGRGLSLTRKAATAIDYRRDGDRNHVTVRLARR